MQWNDAATGRTARAWQFSGLTLAHIQVPVDIAGVHVGSMQVDADLQDMYAQLKGRLDLLCMSLLLATLTVALPGRPPCSESSATPDQ